MKKAQITIFIIIGLIILSATSFFVYKIVSGKKQIVVEQESANIGELSPLVNYVSLCVEQVGTLAIKKMGEQGRLFPKAYIETPSEIISYSYYKGDDYFPGETQFLEEEVSNYVKNNLDSCLNDFPGFDYPITTKDSQMKVTTSFNSDIIQINVIYPITAQVGSSSITVSNFNGKIPLKFQPIYEFSKQINKKTIESPDWIDFEFIFSSQYTVTWFKINEDTYVYEIKDDAQLLNNEPFIYRFAIKVDLTHL